MSVTSGRIEASASLVDTVKEATPVLGVAINIHTWSPERLMLGKVRGTSSQPVVP